MTFEAIIIVGVVIAASVAYGLRVAFRGAAAQRVDVESQSLQNDLTSAQEAATIALRALEMEKDKLSDEEYQQERRALLSYGAAAMRQLDTADEDTESVDHPKSDTLTAVEQLNARREELGEKEYLAQLTALMNPMGQIQKARWLSPQWEGALWMLGIVAVIAGIVLFLDSGGDVSAKDGVSQNAPPAREALVGPDEAEWQEALTKDPNNIEALNTMCWFEIQRRNDVEKAMEYNERAKVVDAKNPDTRFHHALLLFLQKLPDSANDELDKLIADHPDHADALEFRGLFYVQEGKFALGKAMIVRAEEATKDGKARIRLRRFIQQVEMREKAAAQANTVLVSGTITASDLPKLSQTAVIFVSLRSPEGGPPVAAKKLPIGPFPLTFTVKASDQIGMGGQRPLPKTFNLAIRVDGDGNAMSRESELPEVKLEALEVGTTGLTIDLR